MKILLEALEGPEAGRCFELEGPGDYLVGRISSETKPDVSIGAADRAASRSHFRVAVGLGECRIRDAGSANGTFYMAGLGERRLRGERAVVDGDIVRAGDSLFRFRFPGNTGALDNVRTEEAGVCSACGVVLSARPFGPLDEKPDYDLLCDACALGMAAGPAGREIRGYLVLSLLGRGAMGAVWKVWHALSLGVFAIKEARSELRPDAKAAILFLREIEVMRSLRHPNLVRLVDYGREGEEHYFVSEYQRGGSLQDRLAARGGFLPVCEAVAAVVDALAGLERMHEAGFVHRDIKPSNILFPKPGSGTARLADFGLSKRFLAAGSSGVTRPGESAGTVGFMSPEQISDYRRSDPRSDIYSMGATLYRLLSGRPPVQGGQEGVIETLEGKIKPLSFMAQLPGGQALPAGLAEVVMRALAIDPRDRWEGARAFRTALAPYAPSGPEVIDGPAVMNVHAGGRI